MKNVIAVLLSAFTEADCKILRLWKHDCKYHHAQTPTAGPQFTIVSPLYGPLTQPGQLLPANGPCWPATAAEGCASEVVLEDTAEGGALGLDADPAFVVQVGEDLGQVVQLGVLQGRQTVVAGPPVQLKVVAVQLVSPTLAAGWPVDLKYRCTF